MSDHTKTHIIAVSNRLPIRLERDGFEWAVYPGSGGLVSALVPALRNRGGSWIGWHGTTDNEDWVEVFHQASLKVGLELFPVSLTKDEVEGFYNGFSNQIIWPLFHDLSSLCNFDPQFWQYYLEVNDKFAEVIVAKSGEQDFIWVHDYHLLNVGQMLRTKNVHRRAGFFLHIPFPAMEIFVRLPWRAQLLQALLEYDLIGFQSIRDRRHFLRCLFHLIPNIKIKGRGAVVTVVLGDREVRIGTFPISIDSNIIARRANSENVNLRTDWIRSTMSRSKVILGIDRLDYTKGIIHRLKGFRLALEKYPDLLHKVTYVQIVIPSRAELPQYKSLKSEIERLVSEINGQFTDSGWVPVHYIYRSLDPDDLLAHYRVADIGLVTPLIDGMNLVAKEYCACKIDNDGVLILSEFAGAAVQLQRGALLINPYDIEAIADAINTAFHMPVEEKQRRMRWMRGNVRRYDIFRWVDSFIHAALDKNLGDFPPLSEYVPEVSIETYGEA